MFDVITIGEPMVVFIAEELGSLKDVNRFSKGLAGAELNVSIGLSRLGNNVSYVTQLGEDPFGEFIYDCIDKEININKEYISKTSNFTTGFYIKSKVLNGDPSIFYYRKNSAAANMDLRLVERVDLDSHRHLHVTGITPPLSKNMLDNVFFLIKKAKEKGLSISFDPNLRLQLWPSRVDMIATLNYIASFADYIIPNLEEGKILTGKASPEEIADFYLEKGVKNVVVKLGEKGSYVKNDIISKYVKGFVIDKVVDTVGAGDAFAAGVISGVLKGKSIVEAATIGNAMGAIAVMHKGDNEGLPTLEELEAFIGK